MENTKTVKLKDIQIANNVEAVIILRKRLGLNQWEFSQAIGVTQNYLSNVEGYKSPFTSNLEKKVNLYLSTLEAERVNIL